MEFSEKNLEDIIFNANRDSLSAKGLTINGKLLRQIRIGNYGVCDLMEIRRPLYAEGFNQHASNMEINIYELKKNEINFDSYSQALRYAKGVQSYLQKRNILCDVSIVLIGRTMDFTGGFVYLPDMSFVKCMTYTYTEDGIKFIDHNGYKLKDEGF